MKKRIFLTMLLLGGLLMIGFTGCGENKNSREWIENKVSEVSRVYPTENLFDLFKQFPEGFKVNQVFIKRGTYIIEITLQGDSSNQTISGVLTKTRASDDITEKPEETIKVDYIDGKFIFSDEKKAKELWPFDGFLFQKLTINHSFLSSLSMKSKNYNGNNGAFDIDYLVRNQTINQYFKKHENEQAILGFGSSYRNDDYYYYSVTINYDNVYSFRETVSN
ncbi:hypothetical protein, putative lipoprotein [Streptococcus oralis Uo5]|uniref:Lipoprotein n=1 Tax=Streptococcus oralis (strain Uo5) TaxID=927666 RepID=F2QC01_STROU|nr:hypothetical protein [Streptococcus oralis]CBZ00169.1 hypothetical protein, putative lipoprotein [Streptococcus oralis Uo5]